MQLQELGFNDWFAQRGQTLCAEDCQPARVSAVDRGACRIINAAGEVPAELLGRLAFRLEDSAGLPCVGDWVAARYHNDGTAAIIHDIWPRRTFLRRKTAGREVEFQMIAANIDTAFIVQSCHFDFNPARLDRYLVLARDGGVEPVVVLTKTDLVTADELAGQLDLVRSLTQAEVLALSNVSGDGLAELRARITPGRTYCLLGSSGVGKSTLVNRLADGSSLATRAVSASGEGVHTTTRRQLIILESGALLIDTPGMREMGVMTAADGLEAGFPDIQALASQCRYADCRHENEPGCAVRTALASGGLSRERYRSYVKLRKESEFNALSYQDRRKRDKAFGVMVREIKKGLKR